MQMQIFLMLFFIIIFKVNKNAEDLNVSIYFKNILFE